MRCLVFLTLFLQVVLTHAASPRSVNLALDTVLEFDSKNDVHFIRTLQQFLDKLKITITRNTDIEYDHDSDVEKTIKIIDLLGDTISILSSYNDKELEQFAKTLENEINAWLDRTKLSKITQEFGLRQLIDDKLHQIRSLPAKQIRRELKTISRKVQVDKRNRNNGILADFLNNFYISASKAKISNFINNLKLDRARTRRDFHSNLNNIIRSGIESIIDPIVEFGLNFLDVQNEDKLIVNGSDKQTGSNLFKDLFKNFVEEVQEEDTDNEILDYIDRYKRVIDKHRTTNGLLKVKKDSKTGKFKTSTIKNKYTRSTPKKKRKPKPTYSSTEEVQSKLREKTNYKRTTVKTSKKVLSDETDDTSEDKDLSDVKEPILIRIGSSDVSKSEEVSTTTQHTKQRRYKKFTRSQATTKKAFSFIKISNKFRKSLLTTAVSDEGLSIEHYGSLFAPKYNRKNNDNDTFSQNVLSTSPQDAVAVANKAGSTEIIDENISKKVERFDTKDQSNEVKKMTETKNIQDLKKYAVTETIKLNSTIFIEPPINITNLNKNSVEVTTTKPNNVDLTTKRSLNDFKTKYYNIKKIKPTLYLRSHDSNETDLIKSVNSNTGTTTPFNLTTVKTPEDIDIKTESIKTTADDLENELESIIDKYNTSSTIPVEFDNFLKESETNNGIKSKIKDQMKADLAMLLASTTAENAVTAMYTDPFSDLDAAVDLLK